MGKLTFFAILVVLLVTGVFTATYFFLFSGENVEKHVERTCPKCQHGNFLNKVWRLPMTINGYLRPKSSWDRLSCEFRKYEMVSCNASCLTIVLNKNIDDGAEFPYEGLMMTCAADYNIVRDWPDDLPRPEGIINETLSISQIVNEYQVSYIYHKIQYKDNDIFKHVMDYGFSPVEQPILDRTPAPNFVFYYSCVAVSFIVFLILLMIRICCAKSLSECFTSKQQREQERIKKQKKKDGKDGIKMKKLKKKELNEENCPTPFDNKSTNDTDEVMNMSETGEDGGDQFLINIA